MTVRLDNPVDLSGYVPYTGATGDVNLGDWWLTTLGLGTFGSLALNYADSPSTGAAFLAQNTGGVELITAQVDRDFSGAPNWTGTNWSLVGGAWKHNAIAADSTTLLNANLTAGSIIAGRAYVVTFTVTGRTGGTVRPFIGAAYGGAAESTNATFTHYIIALANNANLIFTPTAAFDGSIDNISVERIENYHTVLNNGNFGVNVNNPAYTAVIQLNNSTVFGGFDKFQILDAASANLFSIDGTGKMTMKNGSGAYDQSNRFIYQCAGARIDFLNLAGNDYLTNMFAGYNVLIGSGTKYIKLTGAITGVLTLAAFGNTNNENLTFDFETTANTVAIASGTGVTDLTWTGSLSAAYFKTSTAPTANSTGTVTIVAKDASLLTANAGWLPVKKSDGTIVYLPYWA